MKMAQSTGHGAGGVVARVADAVRRIVGVPDYDAYVRHVRLHHPQAEPATKNEFMRQCWEDKYTRPGNRCC
jgi:uncharacterized short protein YbdD (DUF466 family)